MNGLQKFLKARNGSMVAQLFRYCLSGGLAFLVDFGLTVLFTERAGLTASLSATIGYVSGLVITYLLSIFWIFDKHRFDNRFVEFLLFGLIGLVGIALTFGLMKLFTGQWHIHYILSKLITVVLTTLWNFFAKKLLLFSRKKP